MIEFVSLYLPRCGASLATRRDRQSLGWQPGLLRQIVQFKPTVLFTRAVIRLTIRRQKQIHPSPETSRAIGPRSEGQPPNGATRNCPPDMPLPGPPEALQQ